MLIGGVVVAVVLGWLCWPLWIAKREEWQADNGPRGQAYERAREPCRICKTPIKQFVQGQRSTYWCATCQR